MDTMTKRETLTAGDILHCGWGSDMSINDYYEVTRVTPSGKTAYIRPLRKTYAGSPNDMGGCRAYPMVAGEGRFGLSDTAIVRRDLMDGEESVLAIRDNWEVADFDACEWSDPNAADPYICVVYDLRRLAEDEDGKPRRMKGTMRCDTHYSLSGFDYLTFPAK